MSVRFQKTPRGEVAILPRKDYELLVAKASEADEDAGTARIVARAGKEIAGGGPLRDADAGAGPENERKFNGVCRDQPGHGIADDRKKVRGAEEQQDVGARNDRRDRAAKPIADDRRAAGLRQPAAKTGQAADA